MKTEQTLEQQLAEIEKVKCDAEKSASKLREEIVKRDKANKPKSIMDKVNDYSDILNILEADESKDVIKW